MFTAKEEFMLWLRLTAYSIPEEYFLLRPSVMISMDTVLAVRAWFGLESSGYLLKEAVWFLELDEVVRVSALERHYFCVGRPSC